MGGGSIYRVSISAVPFLLSAGQLTVAFGVAAGAIALRASEWLLHSSAGENPQSAFHLAFVLIAALGALGLIDLVALPRGAGAHVSGHRSGR